MTTTDDKEFQEALRRVRKDLEAIDAAERLSADLSIALASQTPGLPAVFTRAKDSPAFDAWMDRRLNLSEDLARTDYGDVLVDAAWAHFTRTAASGLQTYFTTDHHPWGALVKWFLACNADGLN